MEARESTESFAVDGSGDAGTTLALIMDRPASLLTISTSEGCIKLCLTSVASRATISNSVDGSLVAGRLFRGK